MVKEELVAVSELLVAVVVASSARVVLKLILLAVVGWGVPADADGVVVPLGGNKVVSATAGLLLLVSAVVVET